MSQEVILMNDVQGLGYQGDIVKVADGYARNYLFPRNLAALVTDATRRRIDKLKKEGEAKRAQERAVAQDFANKLSQVSCTITAKVGAEGKMFGSVTSHDILAALKQQNITLDKHQIDLAQPIRELGVFKVPVKIAQDVQAELKVWVVEE